MRHSKSKLSLSFPELGMIAATRGMLGVGIGLLVSTRLSDDRRKAVGLTLLAIGLLSTIPLGFEVFGGGQLDEGSESIKPAA